MSENVNLLELCRCCQCKAGVKSLSALNEFKGSDDSYEKMLRDVFDISLTPYNASPTICTGCISDVQSAAAFKQRVIECEERLRGYSHLEVKQEPEVQPEPSLATQWNLDDVKLDVDIDDGDTLGIESDDNDDQPLVHFKDEKYMETVEQTKQKSYICNLCYKGFSYKGSLEIHLKAHRGEKTLPCLLCDTKYCSHKELNRHITKKHYNGQRYICNLCPENFGKPRDLKIHINIHFENRYKCDMCTKVFRRKKNLDSHMNTHTEERKYMCEVCKKSFRHNQTLKVHMYVHTGEKPHVCDECGNSFTQSNHLRRHIFRIHRGVKNYSCNVCHKKFTSKTYMLTHERLHKGGKPFSCQVCSKKFTLHTSLRVHLKLHSGIKPYNCSQCCRNFAQISSLKLHERSHTGEKPFSCSVCKKPFSNKGYLRIHMRVHTGEKPFCCGVCKRDFREKGQMKRHMRTHTGEKFTCNVCNKQISNLTKHMKVHVKSGSNVCETDKVTV